MIDKYKDRKSGPLIILQHIPMTVKTVLLTITAGFLAWTVLDRVESEKIEESLNTHFMAMLNKDAMETQAAFFSYINFHSGVIKIILSIQSIKEYIGEAAKNRWSVEDDFQIAYHSEIPEWLPEPSMLRKFFYVNYALLLDERGNVREVYHGRRDRQLPEAILNPTQRLIHLSHGQSYMALFDNTPYLIRSEHLFKSKKGTGVLMLVSPIDAEFFKIAQIRITHKTLSALTERATGRIISSSDPEILPTGSTLDAYNDKFLITSKSFFDYGASELQMKFVTFISNEAYKKLTASILSEERSNRAIGDAALIFTFIVIMIWVTRKVKKLNERVMYFSNKLGITSEELGRGDEIVMLDNQFQHMFKEVESTTMELRRYSDHLGELVNERTSEISSANEKIKKSLNEKEVLLSEIHHRVKNNLQVISSMLRLQSKFVGDRDVNITDILNDSRSRIKSMALIHEKLYMSHDFSNVNIKDYIITIADELLRTYSVDSDIIRLNVEIEDIELTIDTAIPLGLILNELITNSIKYAFPDGRGGEITIFLRKSHNEMLNFVYRDSGTGMPDNMELEKPKTLGIHLIKTFIKQLRGELSMLNNDGLEVSAHFKG